MDFFFYFDFNPWLPIFLFKGGGKVGFGRWIILKLDLDFLRETYIVNGNSFYPYTAHHLIRCDMQRVVTFHFTPKFVLG